jgi:hypothetical protein
VVAEAVLVMRVVLA